MCPRSTLGTISKCQPWKHSKVRSISQKSDATKQLPSCRIHTIEGYAFAGSEHISMLVINDNPIKVHFVPKWRDQHQHPQDCRLLCLRRPQARQVLALVLQCEAPACGEIRRWWSWSGRGRHLSQVRAGESGSCLLEIMSRYWPPSDPLQMTT